MNLPKYFYFRIKEGLKDVLIEDASDVDVQEVVRCGECIFYTQSQKSKPWNSNRRYCNRTVTLAMDPHDYCSRGKRAFLEE